MILLSFISRFTEFDGEDELPYPRLVHVLVIASHAALNLILKLLQVVRHQQSQCHSNVNKRF